MLSAATAGKIPHMHKMQLKSLRFLLGLQETWSKLHHILPRQIDYLDVAGTVRALTVMYGRPLSRFAIHTARSEHTSGTLFTMHRLHFKMWIYPSLWIYEYVAMVKPVPPVRF